MKPTALIAEDEAHQRLALRELLSGFWPELQIVAECADGPSALAALNRHRPNIAFLDIRMPGINGLEVARYACRMAHIIFTTAYEEHAVSAFEAGALDYLLKPITAERLALTMQRLQARFSELAPDISNLIDTIKNTLSNQSPSSIRWVTASVGNAVKLIPIEEILFFRAEDKYTRVVSRNESVEIRTPLKELLLGLDPVAFWQINRSTIVHVSAIRSVRRGMVGTIEISVDGTDRILSVSQPFRHRFRGM